MSDENQDNVQDQQENAVEGTPEGVDTTQEPSTESNEGKVATDSFRELLPEGVVLPAEWSEEQIELWLEKADPSQGVRNSDGVYLFDPTRNLRAAAAWSTEELLAFLKGELQQVPNGKTSGVIDEYKRRVVVDPAWSNTEILAYYRDSITPKKTESGVWLNDTTRALRKPGDWSVDELKACVLGEIQPAGKNTLVMLAKELHARLKMGYIPDTPAAVAASLRQMAVATTQTVLETPTTDAVTPQPQAVGALTAMNVSYIDEALTRYRDAVIPGKMVSDATGGQAQRGLENLFQYVIKLEGQALVDGLNRIKVFINKHRADVFSPDYAYRFVYGLKGDVKVQRRHVDFVELFLIVTDKNKAKRKQVDIRRMVSGQAPEKVDILVDYFTNHA